MLIFPHNNCMLSLTLLFSFNYTNCWRSTPPSKLSSAVPYYKISLQVYKEMAFTFFFFLITTKADRQEVTYVSTFSEPQQRFSYLQKSAGISNSTFRTVRELFCNTLLYNRWQIKIELAWRDFIKLILNTLVMCVPECFQSTFECLAHEPRISALFK